MCTLGDQDLLDRLSIVDDNALGGAECDAENVAVLLLQLCLYLSEGQGRRGINAIAKD